MRRIVLCASTALLLLSACAQRSLPPREVLRRAVRASKELHTAYFSASGSLREPQGKRRTWNFVLSGGTLQDAGRQVQFRFIASERGARGQMIMDVILLYPCDFFFRPVEMASGTTFLGLSTEALRELSGEWRRVSCKGSRVMQPVSPDPQLLRQQADSIIVTQDLGNVNINGRSAYHYAVVLNAERMLTLLGSFSTASREETNGLLRQELFEGEMWVDTQTFALHRLLWTVRGVGVATEPVMRFDLQLQDHNGVLSSTLPARVRLLTGATLRDTDFSLPFFP